MTKIKFGSIKKIDEFNKKETVIEVEKTPTSIRITDKKEKITPVKKNIKDRSNEKLGY